MNCFRNEKKLESHFAEVVNRCKICPSVVLHCTPVASGYGPKARRRLADLRNIAFTRVVSERLSVPVVLQALLLQ